MGNTQQTNTQPQKQQQSTNKTVSTQRFILQIRDRQIVLDYKNKIKLTIGDVLSFPAGGFEGLHLWDSNIQLARYILKNKQIFTGKSVIQLQSGTGIAAIALKKFTKAQKIAATDKTQQVTINIGKNCQKNQVSQGMIIACISLSQYKNFKAKFDYIIGADLLFTGGTMEYVVNTFDRFLKVGGKAVLVVPYRKQEDRSNQFFALLDNQVFTVKKEKLVDEIYLDSPLLNQVQGYQQYSQIAQGFFYLYTIQKIKQKNNLELQPQPQLQQPSQKPTITMTRKTSQHKKQTPTIQSPKIKIKNQILQAKTQQSQKNMQQHIKRQLQVVKINKNQDQPAYIRNRNKSISQIIAQSEEKNMQVQVQMRRKISQTAHNNEIQVVNKQHQLYNQPRKKSQVDKNSYIQQNQPLPQRDK